MAVNAETLRMHLDYTAWASNRLLDSVTRLTPEELTRDFKTSDRNVLETLAHVFAADRVWLARVNGETRATFIGPEDKHLEVLTKDWPALHQRWRQWAVPLTDQDAMAVIPYRDLKGNAWEQPLWQILLHVVNHGTHHRGQVSGFLRAMGHVPPPLDLIAYYRG
ncbi:MAG TPA: DinB family protein [Terriglobales bacterium]|nr:DinB family protein [Terriglobales bacterium]